MTSTTQSQRPESKKRTRDDHISSDSTGNNSAVGLKKWFSRSPKEDLELPIKPSLTPILFYSNVAQWKELSNFYKPPKPITYNGKEYATAEHIFQSLKFDREGASKESLEFAELIRKASSPSFSKVLGSQKFPRHIADNNLTRFLSVKIRADWEEIKEPIMMQCLRAKFSQDKRCREVLLSTEGRDLVEHSKYDRYWGDGGNGKGKNRLGILLMQLRDELRYH